MRTLISLLSLLLISTFAKAISKDSVTTYPLPDSVKAMQFFAEVKVAAINTNKEVTAGIKTDVVKLSLESEKNKKHIVFEFPETATIVATAMKVDAGEKGELEWQYDWTTNETYQLLISIATDSAENFSLYSGYVMLPKEKKWKLIGTCKIQDRWSTIQQPATFFSSGKKTPMAVHFTGVWYQRNNGSWKNMYNSDQPNPMINLLSHLDSTEQQALEIRTIEAAIANGTSDAKNNVKGVYYTMLKEGTGKRVNATDTVTVFYKGYLFKDGAIFDQTKEKPVTFPLSRLIAGWQYGVSLCHVGGKIKLVIPSAMGYSIRTRSPKIPPNSTLVFEIEVIDTKQKL